jgi:hypothetical protein
MDKKQEYMQEGSKVVCVSISKNQSEWGNNSDAAKYLVVGQEYTLLREPEVHSMHTKLYLKEFPNEAFNSKQFKLANLTIKELDNFDIFEERVKSLLKRWKKFNLTNPQATPSKSIKGFLLEINDDFTKHLME